MSEDLEPEEFDYRAIDPPWRFAGQNVYLRAFRLNATLDEMGEAIDTMNQFVDQAEQNEAAITRDMVREANIAIHDMMEGMEEFQWEFPHLASERWYGATMEDIAHAYWRMDEGRFDDAHEDEDTLHSLLGELVRILNNVPKSSRHGFYDRLNEYLERMDWDVIDIWPPHPFEEEIREAKDLFCLGYYSTALIVLGRSVENSLLDIGHERQVESVHVYGKSVDWDDTKFFHKNEALKQVDMPGEHGKVLSDRQYHEISILINYRNNVAHTDYAEISRQKAIRQLGSAADLLEELKDERSYLADLDDDEIEPVQGQSVD